MILCFYQTLLGRYIKTSDWLKVSDLLRLILLWATADGLDVIRNTSKRSHKQHAFKKMPTDCIKPTQRKSARMLPYWAVL